MTVLAALIGGAQAEVQIAVAEMTVDGLAVRALECTLDQGGFLAAATIVGSLAQQDAALDACAPEGAAFAVTWTWGADAGAAVTASSKVSANACVQAALVGTTSALNGQCSAVVLVGRATLAPRASSSLWETTCCGSSGVTAWPV